MAAFAQLTQVFYVKYQAPEDPQNRYADRDRYRYDRRPVWINLAHVVDMCCEPAVEPRTSTPEGKPAVTSLRANDGHWDVIETPHEIFQRVVIAKGDAP